MRENRTTSGDFRAHYPLSGDWRIRRRVTAVSRQVAAALTRAKDMRVGFLASKNLLTNTGNVPLFQALESFPDNPSY